MNNRNQRIDRFLRPVATPRRRGGMSIPALILTSALLSRLAPAAAVPAPDDSSVLFVNGLLIALGIFVITALMVSGVAMWSRRQDHINEMMSFCMRYLIDFNRVTEGREAAAALGRARDPQALLVLLDVANDEEAADIVRKAAGDALNEMAGRYRKYKKVIDEIKSASEQRDHPRLIEILTRNFEKGEKKYVQAAYVVGREYMREGHYADAKEWLHIAELRNRKSSLYGNEIRKRIAECNARLYAKGDMLFEAGKFYEARERYSAASHDLSEEESKRYSAFLRLACVYCKLGDYVNADQSVLLALKHGQGTDMSLSLNKLLQGLLEHDTEKPAEERQRVAGRLDNLVTEIMEKLYAVELNELSKSRGKA